MTRQEMADVIADAAMLKPPATAEMFDAIAAELRKSCAGCEHFRMTHALMATVSSCVVNGSTLGDVRLVPLNGEGFCHEWKAKS
jgi:hypothetical protein